MFEIRKKSFGETFHLELLNSSSGEFISLLPEYGGSLYQVCLSCKGLLHRLLWSSDTYEEYVSVGIPWYQGALLSPFPDRIKEGKYSFGQDSFQLLKNQPGGSNALHGFLANKPLGIKYQECNNDSARVELEYFYDGLVTGYPFCFELNNVYKLDAKGITIETSVVNTGKTRMPYGQGWHPYFFADNTSEHVKIRANANYQYLLDKDLIPTGERIATTMFKEFSPVNFRNIENMFYYCLELDGENGISIITLRDELKNIDINLWQETTNNGYKFLQLFTMDGLSGIAIEPLTCIPDSFNNHIGQIHLEPNEAITLKYGIFVGSI